MSEGEFLFLGTGGSMGVPVVGCSCSVCTSSNSKNKRYRSSGLIRVNGKQILIDCGPDFRMQALQSNLQVVDGLILTHPHYDHIGGLDDLRGFFVASDHSMPCLLSKETSKDIQRRFDYMFVDKEGIAKLAPSRFLGDFRQDLTFGVNPHTLESRGFTPNVKDWQKRQKVAGGSFATPSKDNKKKLLPNFKLYEFPSDHGTVDFLGLNIRYLSYTQSHMPINGIICGKLAYISDIKDFDESIFEELQEIDTLIISALRFTPSFMHFTVDDAVDFTKKTSAKCAYLTHISHELDHEKTNAYLPANVKMAYDGLKLHFQV